MLRAFYNFARTPPIQALSEPGALTMDVIKLLKEDHQRVKKMLSELEDTTERATKKREELFAEVQAELRLHELVEEEIVYPAFREQSKLKDIVLEGYEEHHVVDLIMDEIAEESVTDETWAAKLKVMKENVEHHVEEEEEKMFPQARKLFSEEDLEELGRRVAARKQQEQQPRAA
ncbi:MAG: hemerythrin domain-containing protein [Terriglobales bacterium]|jgi:hemerythrin-like domain-containing protein